MQFKYFVYLCIVETNKLNKMSNFRIEFRQIDNTNNIKLVKEFDTKKEANKVLKELLKAGRIVKRGYDYFTTSLNLELYLNY